MSKIILAELKNKDGYRPQDRTTVRKPRSQATGHRCMFHVKRKNKKGGSRPQALLCGRDILRVDLCPIICRTLNLL